jgi:excisionase family DNA binding protein
MNPAVATSIDPAPDRDPGWDSPKGWAKTLNVGPRTVYGAIASGELKAAKVNGRDWRTCTAWIREWLERRAAR